MKTNNQIGSTRLGDEFQFEYLYYRVISISPNEVSLISLRTKVGFQEEDYNKLPLEIIIPEYVLLEGVAYSVVKIEKDSLDWEKYKEDEDIQARSLVIPRSVTLIKEELNTCFLFWIEVSEDNPNYSSLDGVLFNKDKTELICYPTDCKNEHYSIPNSVKSIGTNAFFWCKSLCSVELPNSVKLIEERACGYCENLSSVKLSASLETIGSVAFTNCDSLYHINLPSSLKTIEEWAFSESGLRSIEIPKSVVCIKAGAFGGVFKLTSVVSHIENLDKVDFGDYIFSFTKKPCSLYVSKGRIEHYKSFEAWNCFADVKEIEEIT